MHESTIHNWKSITDCSLDRWAFRDCVRHFVAYVKPMVTAWLYDHSKARATRRVCLQDINKQDIALSPGTNYRCAPSVPWGVASHAQEHQLTKEVLQPTLSENRKAHCRRFNMIFMLAGELSQDWAHAAGATRAWVRT